MPSQGKRSHTELQLLSADIRRAPKLALGSPQWIKRGSSASISNSWVDACQCVSMCVCISVCTHQKKEGTRSFYISSVPFKKNLVKTWWHSGVPCPLDRTLFLPESSFLHWGDDITWKSKSYDTISQISSSHEIYLFTHSHLFCPVLAKHNRDVNMFSLLSCSGKPTAALLIITGP